MPGPIVAHLRGVWPDGTVRGLTPPSPTIIMPADTDGIVELTLYRGNGSLKSLVDGSFLLSSPALGLSRTATIIDAEAAVMQFLINRSDTRDRTPGMHRVQASGLISGVRQMITEPGWFFLQPTVGDVSVTAGDEGQRALRSGFVVFSNEYEKAISFESVGFTGYVVKLTPTLDSVNGTLPEIAVDGDQAEDGFNLSATAAYSGTVGWSIYAPDA